MPRNTTIDVGRAWNTWSDRPLEMVFLPLGVRLTPLAFSSSTGEATLFPAGPGLGLGRHDADGSTVEATAGHAGTQLQWRYARPDPYSVVGRWKTLVKGEWGLRFWVNVCLSADDRSLVTFEEADGAAVVQVGRRFVALGSRETPVQVTGHATLDAAVEHYEKNGYFDTSARSRSAAVLMLRYNLEMTADGDFAAAVSDDRDAAIAAVHSALAEAEPATPRLAHSGLYAGSLDAVRDVMGWNTVWDPVNDRAYTSISRNWNQAKFGGFGVWLDDQFYHALLTSLLDRTLPRENIAAALSNATPQGNLACLMTAKDAWVDRTQIPVGAFIVATIHRRLGDMALVEAAYPTLVRNHDWWWSNRDPGGEGLCAYGTSDIGDGLYKGTAFGARNESSMDNAPIHDEAVYDPKTRTLSTWDVGLNSLLCLDAEMLGQLAALLGRQTEAERFAAITERTRRLIGERLWDDRRGLFANRQRTGGFVRSVGPTSFYPLIAGAATYDQIARLLPHLSDESAFGGAFGLPSVRRDDPAYKDNSYWRGRIWPPLNYIVWQGLRRNGRFEEASALARRSLEVFGRSWANRLCPENYNADTGEALDQPDTDGFYGWGALMPLMGVAEVTDVSPWGGWDLVNTGEDVRIERLLSPAGWVDIAVSGGILSLERSGEALFATHLRGRFTQLLWQDGLVAMTLPPVPDEGAYEIVFPRVAMAAGVRVLLDGVEHASEARPGGLVVKLAPCPTARRLNLYLPV
jgi:putative isomerase